MTPVVCDDATVQCDSCNRKLRVNMAQCFRSGWPECCERTMGLVGHKRDIAEAVMEVLERGKP